MSAWSSLRQRPAPPPASPQVGLTLRRPASPPAKTGPVHTWLVDDRPIQVWVVVVGDEVLVAVPVWHLLVMGSREWPPRPVDIERVMPGSEMAARLAAWLAPRWAELVGGGDR